MQLSIRYVTEYAYDGTVTDNLNTLRAQPAQTRYQRLDDYGVRIEPEARVQSHSDYYGTQVLEFGVAKPHDHLSVDVRARVVTTPPDLPPEPEWAALATPEYRAAGVEYLLPWPGDPRDPRVDDLVAAVRRDTPLETIRAVAETIPDRFEYKPGVTFVGSTIEDLLDEGAGVCQDFTHLALLLLRRNGIAARYVSGYLYAPSDDAPDDSAEVDTHAWVEAMLPGVGGDSFDPVWVGLDPTNRCLTWDNYVKIGHGRTYGDVPPIK
ncbi:MAG: hypothetical protein QOF76_3707, partial [Solirubrobacteraceae bacterium]|nr:hypothetical protein [Solirubrobacteraceae bacterium]